VEQVGIASILSAMCWVMYLAGCQGPCTPAS
jgi:hypothetical protein